MGGCGGAGRCEARSPRSSGSRAWILGSSNSKSTTASPLRAPQAERARGDGSGAAQSGRWESDQQGECKLTECSWQRDGMQAAVRPTRAREAFPWEAARQSACLTRRRSSLRCKARKTFLGHLVARCRPCAKKLSRRPSTSPATTTTTRIARPHRISAAHRCCPAATLGARQTSRRAAQCSNCSCQPACDKILPASSARSYPYSTPHVHTAPASLRPTTILNIALPNYRDRPNSARSACSVPSHRPSSLTHVRRQWPVVPAETSLPAAYRTPIVITFSGTHPHVSDLRSLAFTWPTGRPFSVPRGDSRSVGR